MPGLFPADRPGPLHRFPGWFSAGAVGDMPEGRPVTFAGLDPATTGCNQHTATQQDGQLGASLALPLRHRGRRHSAGHHKNVLQSRRPVHVCYPTVSLSGSVEDCNDGYYSGTAPAYTDMVDGTSASIATVFVYDATGTTLLTTYTAQQ